VELIYRNRRRSVTTGTGTGNLTLAAPTGAWTAIDEADFAPEVTFTYSISGGSQWEVGRGHLESGNVLVRDYVLDNSDGDTGSSAQLSFSAGTKDVFVTFAADVAEGVSELCEGGVGGAGRANTETTTDATPTGIVPRLNLVYNGASCVVELYVIAQTADFKTKSWKIVYMLVNDGVTPTIYGEDKDVIAESESLTWDVDASLDGSNHQVTVTGAAATTIDWYVYGSVKALVPIE
jgi:hypothetical protein